MGAPLDAAGFAARMARLGPFPPAPRIAVAVSGGADSLALAWLAGPWARARGGEARGLIVDHGLRPGSAVEAATAAAQLEGLGVQARVLRLRGLSPGPGLAARARAARYAALAAACAEAGIAHLLLGHHAADQAETLILRALAGSDVTGMAGMAAATRLAGLWLLRPLLDVPPGALRATLTAAGLGWAEDPSNRDQAATRARLRALRGDLDGGGFATSALVAAARAAGAARAAAEARAAAFLAAHVVLHDAGFAVLPPGPVPVPALAWLIAAVGGAARPPSGSGLARLAARPGPATLGGARLLPAGRLGPGWRLEREVARVAPEVPAEAGARWDRRWRLEGADAPPGAMLGALGADAARLRAVSRLPASVLAGLPAIRRRGTLVAVPPLGWGEAGFAVRFAPLAGSCFVPFRPG